MTSNPLTQAEEQAVREREAKATPGPWRSRIDDDFPSDRVIEVVCDDTDLNGWVIIRDEDITRTVHSGRNDENDYAFIACARTAVPQLLAALDSLRAALNMPGASVGEMEVAIRSLKEK